LPSEYHPKRKIRLISGKTIYVRNDNYLKTIDGENNNPRLASKKLSDMFRKILNHRSYYRIPKDKRLYFRVIEPHKDGTPHTHALFYIPKEYVKSFVASFKRLYADVEYNIQTDIKNSTAYMMKYVLKTLDDLRQDQENFTDLTYWYVYWGICRIYTSRTFPSLEVYRRLKGRFSLLELHYLQKKGLLHIYQDLKTQKVDYITLDIEEDGYIIQEGVPLWTKNSSIRIELPTKRYEKVPSKFIIRKKDDIIPVITPEGRFFYKGDQLIKPTPIPARMKDLELVLYYKSFDPDDLGVSYAKFAVVHNEMVERELIEDEIIPLQFAVDLDSELGFDEEILL